MPTKWSICSSQKGVTLSTPCQFFMVSLFNFHLIFWKDAFYDSLWVLYLDLNRKMLTHDRRSEPRVGERVPYVIIYGTPGVPLIQLVRRPVEVMQDPTLRLNATYYITKQILPPLARIFSLIGIDVFNWYHELPRVSLLNSICAMTIERIYLKFSGRLKFLFIYYENKANALLSKTCKDATLLWFRFLPIPSQLCQTDQIIED